MVMGLFRLQDQHGDNSLDIDENSASGARGNENEFAKNNNFEMADVV